MNGTAIVPLQHMGRVDEVGGGGGGVFQSAFCWNRSGRSGRVTLEPPTVGLARLPRTRHLLAGASSTILAERTLQACRLSTQLLAAL